MPIKCGMRSDECGISVRRVPQLRTRNSALRTSSGSQGVISSARRSAKAEVRGANPRESANSKPLCLQQLQGEFRKLVFVGASPTRGSSRVRNAECGVQNERRRGGLVCFHHSAL